jgi:hypothetical protein
MQASVPVSAPCWPPLIGRVEEADARGASRWAKARAELAAMVLVSTTQLPATSPARGRLAEQDLLHRRVVGQAQEDQPALARQRLGRGGALRPGFHHRAGRRVAAREDLQLPACAAGTRAMPLPITPSRRSRRLLLVASCVHFISLRSAGAIMPVAGRHHVLRHAAERARAGVRGRAARPGHVHRLGLVGDLHEAHLARMQVAPAAGTTATPRPAPTSPTTVWIWSRAAPRRA